MANGMTGPLQIWQVLKYLTSAHQYVVVRLVAAEDVEEAKRKAIRFCSDDWDKVALIE